MSSKLFKTVFAGAVTVGALLLPVSAAQAAPKHHPCDRPSFGHRGFSGHGFGFHNSGFGFHDAGFGFPDDGFGFPDDGFGFGEQHRQHHDTTVIIVTQKPKKHHHHHKPAPTGNAAGAGYHTPAATSAGDNGYHRKSTKDS